MSAKTGKEVQKILTLITMIDQGHWIGGIGLRPESVLLHKVSGSIP